MAINTKNIYKRDKNIKIILLKKCIRGNLLFSLPRLEHTPTVGNVIFQPPSSSPAADHVLHHHFLLPLNQHPDKNNEIEERLGTSPSRGLRSHKGAQP